MITPRASKTSNSVRIFFTVFVLPLLVWPALVNGYPLLFPDTIDYLAQGLPILYALFHFHHPAFSGMRSAQYSLVIFPFHGNVTPWPVLLLHAALGAYPIYLTVRSLFPAKALGRTAAIVAALGIGTSLSWYICLLMPDILGAPLYLALYLLVLAPKTLSRAERILVIAIAIIGVTAHSTHLLIALLLCALLGILHLFRWTPLRNHGRDLAFAFAVIVCAALLQIAVNAKLTGQLSLGPNRPPYLEARIIGEGPGRTYLSEHCLDHPAWLLCLHADKLGNNDDEFLWSDKGIWSTSTPSEQAELSREEMPLVWDTLTTYPGEQITASLLNFGSQLAYFSLDDFDNNDYMQSTLDTVMRSGRARYDRSLQARNAVPARPFTLLQYLLCIVSIIAIPLSIPVAVRRRNVRLLGLTAIIVPALIINAAAAGVLSEVDARYQARVIWLLPLLAILFLYDYRDAMRSNETY